MASRRQAFTLIEVLIVVVLLAVFASLLIPSFASCDDAAKASALRSNLHTIRSQILVYKVQHNGRVPDSIDSRGLYQLSRTTSIQGVEGTGPGYPFGPYMQENFPPNPFDGKTNIVELDDFPPTAATSEGGWFYHIPSGQIAANTAGHLSD